MKTYICYSNGVEVGMIKAASHNAAEKKAQKKYGPSPEQIRYYVRVNPFMSPEQARVRLESLVSVAYTEV
jgi:hypothetical protein